MYLTVVFWHIWCRSNSSAILSH